jgi:thiosulfate/3-mercaptopyruvate sulfurtransferase
MCASPLISVEDLARRVGDPDLRIVDVRWYLGEPGAGRAAYEAGHVPGAIHIDLDRDLTGEGDGRHPLPHPADLARALSRAGLGDEHVVVAYDDVGGWVAARLWWMLDRLGHRRVFVLDGGFPAWVQAGLPIQTDEVSWPEADLRLAGSWSQIVDRDEVRARLGRVLLLDARSGPRYRGETEPVDPVAGHIPTAVNAPTDGNLGPDGRFLAPDVLRRRFVELGAGATDRAVITSCGSGVSACHHALAMRVADLPDPILYPGSWSDWSTAGYPAARGAEPGDPPRDSSFRS